jgi:hypothetical protein
VGYSCKSYEDKQLVFFYLRLAKSADLYGQTGYSWSAAERFKDGPEGRVFLSTGEFHFMATG